VYLRDRFATLDISLEIPDLNQDDFSHLTITRQLTQVETAFLQDKMPVTLIGSSLGGLMSAWLGQRHSQVQRLVLLAPAVEFLWLQGATSAPKPREIKGLRIQTGLKNQELIDKRLSSPKHEAP
jgi:hypothetical protein